MHVCVHARMCVYVYVHGRRRATDLVTVPFKEPMDKRRSQDDLLDKRESLVEEEKPKALLSSSVFLTREEDESPHLPNAIRDYSRATSIPWIVLSVSDMPHPPTSSTTSHAAT